MTAHPQVLGFKRCADENRLAFPIDLSARKHLRTSQFGTRGQNHRPGAAPAAAREGKKPVAPRVTLLGERRTSCACNGLSSGCLLFMRARENDAREVRMGTMPVTIKSVDKQVNEAYFLLLGGPSAKGWVEIHITAAPQSAAPRSSLFRRLLCPLSLAFTASPPFGVFHHDIALSRATF